MAVNVSRKINKDNWITMENREDRNDKNKKLFPLNVCSLALSIAMVVIGAQVGILLKIFICFKFFDYH